VKISACLIVKNEKDHINDVIASLTGVDEIIVVDTGSIDNTVELAKAAGATVFTDYKWNDDFAEARNHALSKCTGDWVISIDADEILEADGVEKLKALLEEVDGKDLHLSVIMKHKGSGQVHMLPRIFRNDGSVKWVGAAHETLSPVQANHTNIVIEYGYSTAHALDPDRMLRILTNIYLSGKATARDVYYLAREHYYRRDWQRACNYFGLCAHESQWPPERSDAYLYRARCYFNLGQGDTARENCLKAIEINPDFKEALLFMADLHFEPWKHKWERLASVASSEDVLFIRV
jgi:glycosyltransferase involved in cell wall biosynthesis